VIVTEVDICGHSIGEVKRNKRRNCL